MMHFLQANIAKFENFCLENQISAKKALSMPKCYNNEVMYIQAYDESAAIKGLKSNQSADTLLVVHRKENGIEFNLTAKGRSLLAN